MAKGKAYKIRNLTGSKRFGVVADSVDTLLGKATNKLCLKVLLCKLCDLLLGLRTFCHR